MEVVIIEKILAFLKTQYLFWIVVYEVVIMVLYGKLVSLTKSGLEKRVQLSEIEKEDVGMHGGSPSSYPFIRIKQIIRNGSEVPLRIIRVDVALTVNKMKLDTIQSSNFPANWITTKDKTNLVPPNDLDFWITYATTRLKQTIPDFNNNNLIIEASGKIELRSRTTRIEKDVKGEIEIEPKEWE